MDQAEVEIELSLPLLMSLLHIVTPTISINGNAERREWGTHRFTLAPGPYEIAAWYPWMFVSRASRGATLIDLAAGGSYRLRYRPAVSTSLAGSMKVIESPTLPQARSLPRP